MLEIVNYLNSKGIKTERHGSYIKTKCFLGTHKDHDPSFTIYDNDTWYCFGCGKGSTLNDLKGFFGDPVVFAPKVLRDPDQAELLKKMVERKREAYTSVRRVRRMRSWYTNLGRLNARLLRIIIAHENLKLR